MRWCRRPNYWDELHPRLSKPGICAFFSQPDEQIVYR